MSTYTVYEEQTAKRLRLWERDLTKPKGMLERASKSLSTKINSWIPEKVHGALTASVKGIVKTSLFTAEYIPKQEPLKRLSLADRDTQAEALISRYKKIAAAEGAGTGAGGIMLGFVDFPVLIGIKIKFLFELAHVYGYSTRDYRERLFVLYIFQLAFSSPDKQRELLNVIKDWPARRAAMPPGEAKADVIDWRQLQQEYRDTIDFRKMLQMIPGVGAVVGAWANYGLLEELGQTGMQVYRMRWLQDKQVN
ncbi:EcsC family protein [Paenibacillus daejeonensis]|uniref:EcsC family protein n=1 Tax=Paenibacillus daejeonensis TaxID=135193 RepID=UPI00037A0475|nr:EcsC family protein [Paenibacillus daejeonensis]